MSNIYTPEVKNTSKSRINGIKKIFLIRLPIFILFAICSCSSNSKSSGSIDLIYTTYNPYVKINEGKKHELYLIDTGSPGSTFPRDNHPELTYQRGTYMKNAKGREIRIFDLGEKKIKIGNLTVSSSANNRVLAAKDKYMSDRLIGMNLLSGLTIDFDLVNNKINLSKDQPPQNFEEDTKLPITIRDNLPYITIYVNGEKKEFILDSGFAGFGIINNKSSCDNIWTSKPVEGFDNNNADQVSDKSGYCLDNLLVGELQFNNEVMMYNAQVGANILGFHFFSRFERVVIDLSSNMLHLVKKRKGTQYTYIKTLYEYVNSIGFSFSTDKYPIVTGISSKLKQPIQIGDTLHDVNNVPMITPLTYKSLGDTTFSLPHFTLRWLRYSPYRKITLSVRKNNEIKKFTIDRIKQLSGPLPEPYWDVFFPDDQTRNLIEDHEYDSLEKL